MTPDWYPISIASRVAWHANFAARASGSGLALGLTAGQITQIATDAAAVAAVVNFAAEADGFAQAATAYRDAVLSGDPAAAMPAAPGPPAVPALGGGSLPGIQQRTRRYASILRASPNYTPAAGEHFGIVTPRRGERKRPGLKPRALTASQIELAVAKGGYAVLAIDSRAPGGTWEQIGISMTRRYIDARPPTVAGAPELREYRAQGMQKNARVGDLSPVVSAVTVP